MPVIDFDSLQVPTAAQMVQIITYRIAQVMAFGQSKGTDGSTLTHANLAEMESSLEKWQSIANSEDSASAGGAALVEFRDP